MASPQHFADHMIHEAARHNNGAVANAMSGNAAAASALFKHGLAIFSQIKVNPQTPSAPSSSSAPNLKRNVFAVPLAFSEDESAYCVYNKFFTFDPSMGSGEIDLVFFSSALVFNTGLLFHQQACATGSLKFYVAAKRMYTKALNIVRMIPTFQDADIDALQLAILNNDLHIDFKVGTTKETAENSLHVLRQLSSALLYSESSSPHLEEGMINEIMINSMVSGPGCAASA